MNTQIDYLVVGLGVTGLSCVAHLALQGYKVMVLDSRPTPPGRVELQQQFPHIPLHTGPFSSEWLQHTGQIVLSPGISLDEPFIAEARERGIPITSDIDLFARQAKAPVIAITGTNGKSTVTRLVGDMLQAAGFRTAVGGNLGRAALDLLQEPNPDFYVLELSSFQLDLSQYLAPAVSVLLNISPDHLDRHHTLVNYQASKLSIYHRAQFAVYNADDVATIPSHTLANTSFTLQEPSSDQWGIRHLSDAYFLAQGAENLLDTAQLKIKGRHNWANALAALAVGTAVHLPLQSMLTTLQQFPGLAHRCQWVRELDGVQWYNDSKATNIGASIAAITGLGATDRRNLILIAGGQGKGGDFTELRESVAHFVKGLIVLGEAAPELQELLGDLTPVTRVTSLDAAVLAARAMALPGDTVLLAPACASLDMFKNFEHRGEIFTDCVRALS
jgi:UDP-N-acetylmuramoylalanine--D-glutamate ligase